MMLKRKFKLVQKVSRTPKNAYDHGRFVSSLIEHQLKHFNELEKTLLKAGEKLTDISKIKTELQASKYLKKMTALLHPQGAEKPKKTLRSKRVQRVARIKSKGKPAKRRRRV